MGPYGPAGRRSQAAVPFIAGRSSFVVMRWPFSNIKKGLSMMAYAFMRQSLYIHKVMSNQ